MGVSLGLATDLVGAGPLALLRAGSTGLGAGLAALGVAACGSACGAAGRAYMLPVAGLAADVSAEQRALTGLLALHMMCWVHSRFVPW